MKYEKSGDGVSRRDFVKKLAVGAAVAAGGRGLFGARTMAGAVQIDPCSWSRDVALVNGKFYDGRGLVGSALAIQDGRIASIGEARDLGPCAKTFDLGGRTVIPGLIDSHAHFARAGTNPGHEARGIEASFSIAEIQEVIARRAETVPPSEFITCIGGWNPLQLEEQRLPTKVELDAAAPHHAVYLQPGFRAGGVTNSLGEDFFRTHGVDVSDAGGVSSPGDAGNALRAVQTPEDRLRGTRDIIAHAARLGLTMVHDMGNLTNQPEDYQFMTRLYHDDGGSLGLRMRFYRYFGPDEGLPELQSHIRANFMPTGDGILRPIGVGEQIPRGEENFMAGCRIAAQSGWTVTQHSSTVDENQLHIAAFRAADAVRSIADLRWSLAHVFVIESDVIEALKDLGAGVLVQDQRYLGMRGGPPFRTLVDSGITIGAGTDATNVAPLNPWLALFYMVSGRNLTGDLINDGQQISRTEAIRLYSAGSAWFSRDDQDLGTIEVGKLADLAVLSEDYFTVPEDRIRKLSSVLTLQGGRVVHAAEEFEQG